MDKQSPIPLINRTKKKPITKTKGNIGDIFCLVIPQIMNKGINPTRKFMYAARVEETVKSCTLTLTFVITDEFPAIDSADMISP